MLRIDAAVTTAAEYVALGALVAAIALSGSAYAQQSQPPAQQTITAAEAACRLEVADAAQRQLAYRETIVLNEERIRVLGNAADTMLAHLVAITTADTPEAVAEAIDAARAILETPKDGQEEE